MKIWAQCQGLFFCVRTNARSHIIDVNYPLHEHASPYSKLPRLITCTGNFSGSPGFSAMRYNDWLSDKIRTKFQGNGHKKAIHVDMKCPQSAHICLLTCRNATRGLDALVPALKTELQIKALEEATAFWGVKPLLPRAYVVQARLRKKIARPTPPSQQHSQRGQQQPS